MDMAGQGWVIRGAGMSVFTRNSSLFSGELFLHAANVDVGGVSAVSRGCVLRSVRRGTDMQVERLLSDN
jgi:hypothetical protein